MATWFTADLHLGHDNIIRYCDRPFPDVQQMNEALIDRWNAVVAPGDTAWVLGDMALGTIDDSLALIHRFNGRKLLLAGNHDRCWAGHGPKGHGWEQRYLDAGFDEIRQGVIGLRIGGHDVIACHFPYRGDSRDEDRYVDERPVDRGEWLLHGHVHERWRQHGHMINVGVDAWNCTPVHENVITAMIEAGSDDLAPLALVA